MYKKINTLLALAFFVDITASAASDTLAVTKQGALGSTSSGSFSITLKVEPCVREIPQINEAASDPDERCFNAPGIDFIAISCEGDSSPLFTIFPRKNQFCLGSKMSESLINYINQQKFPGNEPVIIAPN